MKTRSTLLIACCLLTSYLQAQNVTFHKLFFRMHSALGLHPLKQVNDGGYIILGVDFPNNFNNDSDILLIRTDSNGDTLWTKSYGGSEVKQPNSVQQTNDNGYILAGLTSDYSNTDGYLIKTDSIGDTLWTKSYGGELIDQLHSVIQTLDGGYLLGGKTSSFGLLTDQAYLIKTDSIGNIIWTKVFGMPQIQANTLTLDFNRAPDGGYIILLADLYSTYLVKTDGIGNIIWSELLPPVIPHALSVEVTTDSCYVLAGTSDYLGNYNACLLKVDSTGNILWCKSYDSGNNDAAYDIKQTDQGYILVGNTINNAQESDGLVIRTDSEGNLLWSNVSIGPQFLTFTGIEKTADLGFIISGQLFYNGISEDVIIKTDSSGMLTCNSGSISLNQTIDTISASLVNMIITPDTTVTSYSMISIGGGCSVQTICFNSAINKLVDEQNIFKIFPNPSGGMLNIIAEEYKGIATIEIYNIPGTKILSGQVDLSDSKSQLSVTGITPGIYFLKLLNKEGILYTDKLIIE